MADSATRSFTIEALSLLAVSICIILFRTYVRIAQGGIRGLAPDDYLMLLVIIPYSIETSMAYFVGNVFHGLSNSNMTPAQRSALDSESTEFAWRVGGSKSQVTGWVMYSTVLWVIKSALCAFYLRLTGGLPPYKNRIYAGFGIIVVTYITVICSLLFSCLPFYKLWQINPDPGNHCQSAASRVYIFVVVTLNISTDVYLLFIPIPMLWSAQIRKAKKIGLIVLFSGGIFVMVAGILRAVLIIKNPTTGALQSASWAVRESFVAIVTSNLPMTYGWFQQKLKPVLGSWLSSSDTNHKSGPEPGSMILDSVGHHSGWRNEHGESRPSTTGERSIDEGGDGVYMHSDLASSDGIMYTVAMESTASRLRQKSWRRDSYLISTDSSLPPIPKLIEVFSSDEFYWAKAMPEAAMREMLDNSLCFGLYHSPDKTNPDDGPGIFVGIARGVTDFTTFFYLTDVWVDPTYQGKGLGSWLVRCVQEVIESMPHLRRSILMTSSWEKSVPFYERLMGMKVFECRQGEGLAMMERKGTGHPTFGREEDCITNLIRQAAEPLLDEGKQVILVTSSLGGVVGTQSLEALSVTARSSRGQKGGIQKIVYVTSLVIQPDTSPMDFFGPNPPPYTNIPDTEEYIEWTDEVEDGTLTFSDLPPDEARKVKAKMNRFHSKHSFHDRLTYPGYKYATVHYVICEEDKILPKEAQLALIETLKSHSPDGQVTTHSISAGHLPFVTRPADLFQIFQAIASS
ncbi:hypothetical protein NM208_g3161 [Fusarium decemcellulare]|uniref:Uncharacterized protein n=1 Tax=Fusarium decemcellulare TaxID=57161 RepID=A0ACC1SQ88_9HYPO|nr:hypothetical protein NM208_g3161 [Fusarium decemcellulare]